VHSCEAFEPARGTEPLSKSQETRRRFKLKAR
jgi:hypothetical protein